MFIFDIEHPCYGQLTPVKTSYLLTSVLWPYHGLKLRAHRALVFFEVDHWPSAGFQLNCGAHILFICGDQGRTVRKAVNANRVDRSMNFSSTQMFFTVFESWAPGVVRYYLTSKQKANLYKQKTLNAKLKHSVQIPTYRGIASSGFEQPGPGDPLLDSAKSVYYKLDSWSQQYTDQHLYVYTQTSTFKVQLTPKYFFCLLRLSITCGL